MKTKKFNLSSNLIISDLDLNFVNSKLDKTLLVKKFIKLTNNKINLNLDGILKILKRQNLKLMVIVIL